jgi:hypothetical protein
MWKRLALSILCLSFLIAPLHAQNLLEERIRKIPDRKKSIYFDKGIFHNGGPKVASKLKAIRHSYSERQGYERLVFDFESDQLPRIYGAVAGDERKIYLDFFGTGVAGQIGSFGTSRFVKTADFMPIIDGVLTTELTLKDRVNVDIFQLSNPARLVIDIKK